MIRNTLLLTLFVCGGLAAQQKEIPCDQLAEQVRKSVSEDPSRVLLIVEESMKQNELCACEIVKTAIVASNADNKTVKQIVFTASITSPGMAASIGECALAVAPQAAAEISAGVQEAVGTQVADAGTQEEGSSGDTVSEDYDKSGMALDKSGYALDKSGDALDKYAQPVQPVEEGWDSDYGLSPVDIHGVYLIQPVGGISFPDHGCHPISPSKGKCKKRWVCVDSSSN